MSVVSVHGIGVSIPDYMDHTHWHRLTISVQQSVRHRFLILRKILTLEIPDQTGWTNRFCCAESVEEYSNDTLKMLRGYQKRTPFTGPLGECLYKHDEIWEANQKLPYYVEDFEIRLPGILPPPTGVFAVFS